MCGRRYQTSTSSGLAIALFFAWLNSSCQKSASESTETNYPHPNSTTSGMTNVPVATLKTVAKSVSATADTVLTVGKTTVTIPAGAISIAATASLTSYGGVFINNANLTLESEPLLLKIIDMSGSDLTRAHIAKDMVVEIESASKVTASKLAVLLHENGGLDTATKTGIKQSTLSTMLAATTDGRYKTIFKIRPPRMAMVLATTGGGLPSGYGEFVAPPTDVTNLTAAVDSPSQITLTWQADAATDNGFAVVTSSGLATPAACTQADVVETTVETTLDSATKTYSYVLTGLTDGTSYTVRVCGTSFRDPVDLSPGTTITAATPARAAAVLTNTPPALSNLAALNVTVGGTNVVDYRYALLTNAADCSGASYSGSIAVATKITDTLPASGSMILCVLGRISSSNVQLAPTTAAWTMDTTPPVFVSISLANDATDGQIGISEKNNTTAIVGALSATGHDGARYAVTGAASTCNGSLTYASALPQSATLATLPDGSYKVCVQLYDLAGNLAYGSSSSFTLDLTAPVFSTLSLTGDAIDGYINNAEKTLTNALTTAATGSGGVTTTNYALVTNATTCNGSLTYSSTIPKNNDAAMGIDGVYKVCAQLKDAAGNAAYGASNTITRKTTLPAVSALALGSNVLDGYLSIAEKALTTPLAGSITGSNYDTAGYAVVTSATTCNASVTYGSMPTNSSGVITTNNQLYKVCVRVTDTAGNPAAYASTTTFRALIANPTCTGVALSGDAADSYINSTEFTHTTAITTGATGPSATVSTTNYVVIASAATCNATQTFTATPSKANDPAFAVSGTYKICARVADAVSQYGYCASTTMTSTQATITFTSINLAGPATDGYINATEHSTATAIVSGLVGANYTTAKYVVATGATTCNGSLTYSTAVPAANNAGISSDGSTYKVCVQLTDTAGNTAAYGASGTFIYDATAPSFTSFSLANAAADTYINASEHSLATPIANALTATGYTTPQYALVTSGTTCALPLTWVSTIPNANDPIFSADGSYKLCVQLADAAGNTTYASTSHINYDGTPPVFSSLALINSAADGYLNANDVTLAQDVAGSLVATGQTTIRYVIATSVAICSAQAGWATSVPVATDFSSLTGAFKICTELSDAAGNLTYGATSSFTVDRTPPSFTSIALAGDAADGYINSAEHALTNALTASAVGTGYDLVQYALVTDATACATVAVWSASIPRSNSVDFAGDGDYKVCLKLSDNAGNPTDYGSSSTFTFDTIAPAFTSLALAGDASDGALGQVDRTHATTIVGALVASGYNASSYKIGTSGTACSGGLTYSSDELANSTSISADGTYKICVRMVDSAGNLTYDSSSVFDVDTAGPVFTSLTLGAAALDGYLTIAEHAAATSLGGTLTASGQTSSAYALAQSTTTCNVAIMYGGMPNSDDGLLANATSYKICVVITDAAGNSTYGSSASFVTDFAAPTISSASLAAVVADSYLNLADFQASSALISSVTASNYDVIAYAIASGTTTCDGALTYSVTGPKTDDTAMTSDGTWKVCIKASDTAGNPDAFLATTTFTRDITKPNSTVTTTGTVTPNTTAGSTTSITGTASDGTTGISNVVISIQEGSGLCFDESDIDFTANCPHWIASTGTTNWTKSMDDSSLLKGLTYTVSSKSTDIAGNSQTSYGTNSFLFTSSEGTNLWNRDVTYDGYGGDDRALAGASDASGNLYVVGYHTNGDKNWLIKKFSKRGVEDTINWNKDVGDSGVDEIARSVAVDPSGNIYVVGSRFNGSNLDWMIKKYSSAGVEDTANWDMIIDSGSGDDEAMGVTTDTSGNVYVVGYGRNIAGASTGDDLWVKKFTASGVLSCEQKLDEGGANLGDRLTAVAVNSSTPKMYVAGHKTIAGPDQQLVIKRLRTADCSIESTATGNSAGSFDYATAIKIDNAGNVIVTGVNSASGQDWWIRKYSAALAISADFNPAGAGAQAPLGLTIDAANRIYVGGFKTNANEDTWIRQFSSSLVENLAAWNQVADGAGAADQVTAMVTSTGTNNTDQIYVIGWSTNKVSGSSGADWWLKKLAGP